MTRLLVFLAKSKTTVTLDVTRCLPWNLACVLCCHFLLSFFFFFIALLRFEPWGKVPNLLPVVIPPE